MLECKEKALINKFNMDKMFDKGKAHMAFLLVKNLCEDSDKDSDKDSNKDSDKDSKKYSNKYSNKKMNEYKNVAQSVQKMILTNGLGATICYLSASDKNVRRKVLEHINCYVVHYLHKDDKRYDLKSYLCTLNSNDYRLYTQKIIMFIGWIVRFSNGIINCNEITEKSNHE